MNARCISQELQLTLSVTADLGTYNLDEARMVHNQHTIGLLSVGHGKRIVA